MLFMNHIKCVCEHLPGSLFGTCIWPFHQSMLNKTSKTGYLLLHSLYSFTANHRSHDSVKTIP